MSKESKLDIFGIQLDTLTLNETVDEIVSRIKRGEVFEHVSINANKIKLMNSDSNLKEFVRNAGVVSADGISIVKAVSIVKKVKIDRVPGIDIFTELLSSAEKENLSVYFLGAREEVIKKMLENSTTLYPKLKIVGYRNGYFTAEEESDVVKQIADCSPDILFIGITSPFKEYFINRNIENLNCKFLMGVGGSFDVLAGKVTRAPRWIQDLGFEWFYRFVQEPKRLFKRYFIESFEFAFLLIHEKLNNK